MSLEASVFGNEYDVTKCSFGPEVIEASKDLEGEGDGGWRETKMLP
jgi:hypothetical protein